MKSTNEYNLKDLMMAYFKANHTEMKFYNAQLQSSWEKIVGKTIAQRTKSVFLKDKKLFIRLDSSSLKNDLMYLKPALLQKLNEALDANIIEAVEFL